MRNTHSCKASNTPSCKVSNTPSCVTFVTHLVVQWVTCSWCTVSCFGVFAQSMIPEELSSHIYIYIYIYMSVSRFCKADFSSRWYLCAHDSPYALHPGSQEFPQHIIFPHIPLCVNYFHKKQYASFLFLPPPPPAPPQPTIFFCCWNAAKTQLHNLDFFSCKKPRLTWNDQPRKLWPFELVLEALTTHTHTHTTLARAHTHTWLSLSRAHTHTIHVHTYTHTIPFLASEHKEEILFTSSLLGGGVMVQHLLLHTQDSEGLSQQLPVSSQLLVKVITHTDAPLCAVRSHISPSFSHQVTYLEGLAAGALVGVGVAEAEGSKL